MKFTTCLWQNIDKNNTAVTSILTSRWWSKSYQESSSHCRQQFLQCAKLLVKIIFSARFVLSHPQLRWTPAWHPCWRWSPGLCWHWQFCGTWKVTKLSLSSLPVRSWALHPESATVGDTITVMKMGGQLRSPDAVVAADRAGTIHHLTSGPSYRTSPPQFSFTSSCPGQVWVRSLQKWPQGAAWAWVHF